MTVDVKLSGFVAVSMCKDVKVAKWKVQRETKQSGMHVGNVFHMRASKGQGAATRVSKECASANHLSRKVCGDSKHICPTTCRRGLCPSRLRLGYWRTFPHHISHQYLVTIVRVLLFHCCPASTRRFRTPFSQCSPVWTSKSAS